MNVTIINKSDSTGGAAVVSRRLMEALRDCGINARMLVIEKLTDSPYVEVAASRRVEQIPFLAERLKIFIDNGFNRADLFKVDTASDGLPLWRHPWVKEADIICLNWINQGMLSLKGIRKIMQLGKPVVWTMHDMWNMTGICHHAGSCPRWKNQCGCCHFLGSKAGDNDISHKVWGRKRALYQPQPADGRRIHFVAVSNWLAKLAKESRLLADASLEVIPNAFPLPESSLAHIPHEKFRIVMGAARLDDPIKGLPILIEATRILHQQYPHRAPDMELITFGNIRNPQALDDIAISHRHLGLLNGEEAVRKVYLEADAVVSTSLYETLPGTLVEGLAYGCVPVAFNRGGQSDIIDHLSTGYLAEFDEDYTIGASNIATGLIWALEHNNESMRELMHSEARRKFGNREVADRYIDLFKQLLQSSN